MTATVGAENASENRKPGDLATEVEPSYRILTEACGFLDLGVQSWLRLVGADTAKFLQGMVTQDVSSIQPGSSAASWILAPTGKIEAWVLIFRTDTGHFLMQVPDAMAGSVQTRLDRYLIMEDVQITESTLRNISVQGPDSRKVVARIRDRFREAVACPHDRCGHGGFDLLCEPERGNALIEALIGEGLAPIEPRALEAARLEGFLPLYGSDMVAGVNPMIYGEGGRISRTKGCYIGQETVAMTRDRGRPPQVLVLLKSDSGEPSAPGTALLAADKEVGAITSSAWSPGHRAALAMATVKFGSHEPGQRLHDGDGKAWTILKKSHIKPS